MIDFKWQCPYCNEIKIFTAEAALWNFDNDSHDPMQGVWTCPACHKMVYTNQINGVVSGGPNDGRKALIYNAEGICHLYVDFTPEMTL